VHKQIAATALATTVDQISLKQSDTAHGGHDTGAYGSAGTFVAGLATKVAAENLATEIKAFAASAMGLDPASSVLDRDAVVSGQQRVPFALVARTAREQGRTISAHGNSGGTPRSKMVTSVAKSPSLKRRPPCGPLAASAAGAS